MVEDINLYFLKRTFNIREKYNTKIVKKKKLLNDFDKLFFNFLNLIQYDLNILYNRNEEKNIKYEISHKLENVKFKQINNVIENLCYEDHISLYTLNCLSFYYKLNIIYAYDAFYYKMIYNENCDIYYIVNNHKDFFNIKHDKLNDFLKDKYEIKDICKPIYSLSHYKVCELEDIINCLKIPLDETIKYKKEMYYELMKAYFNNNILK